MQSFQSIEERSNDGSGASTEPKRVLSIQTNGMHHPLRLILQPNSGDLVDQRERELLRIWRAAKLAFGILPRIDDLKGFFFASLQPHLIMLNATAGGNFLISHYGNAIVDAYGRDNSGRKTSELPGPDARAYETVYRIACKHGQPVATFIRTGGGRHNTHWSRLILPTKSGNNGDEYLLVVLHLPTIHGNNETNTATALSQPLPPKSGGSRLVTHQ